MDEKELKRLESALNHKKKGALKKIVPMVGREIAVLLASVPHSVSPKELEVIATFIGAFDDLRIHQYNKLPYGIVIEGKTTENLFIRFTPQYRVTQPVQENGKQNTPWSVDLAVHLFTKVNNREFCIAALGYEYDGHISHYVETGIKNAYVRDWNILITEDTKVVRLAPDHWNKNASSYISGLKKYLKKKSDNFSDLSGEIAKSNFANRPLFLDINDDTIITCKVCNGRGNLASMECPCCNGMGSIARSKMEEFDMSYCDRIPCPECSGAVECKPCRGSGFTNRDALLNYGH